MPSVSDTIEYFKEYNEGANHLSIQTRSPPSRPASSWWRSLCWTAAAAPSKPADEKTQVISLLTDKDF
ncbi:hypothetical protein PF010_g2030 [Phytophthora fragariae]|uniref:Uncharacterized protein n=1 Tax=Phytophthora fragariae TaxID=53985 RepID=A0A6A4A9Q6_9STRA|nr:hypothetical protein PF003_g8543 [Phytophthora fragariae]KAE8946051.1 hypothetical protein PF009_g4307 [Phytophthora fragariae]KAE9135604.1 hypothetical protein PF010_g2030 [Phytophthora fragariae]KAE9251102.1 hypothetical protein PF002_g4448 [Phytophthora fragariae]KAE9326867.1 hypothetical protein PF001_g2228 [Phytophthora fragariae]